MDQVIAFIMSISFLEWLIMALLLVLLKIGGVLLSIEHVLRCLLDELEGADAYHLLSSIRDDVGDIREKVSVTPEELSEA
jgi:hypothetical protein